MSVHVDPSTMLPSPLSRLHYFDGLFLRAELLRRDQDGMRSLVFQSNIADGAGIASGLDASIDGDTVAVEPGLAVDGQGRVLLLVDRAEASLTELLGRRPVLADRGSGGRASFAACEEVPSPPSGGVAGGTALYAIVLRHAESACGWEEVRGRACEDACDASMERPYLVETARISLCPVTLTAPVPGSRAVVLHDGHLRSQIAAAFFADERDRTRSLVSAAGLRTTVWCRGAVTPAAICGDDVPVALIAVRNGAAVFLDPWIARRERMETPPRRYWAGRMAMRAWDLYQAEVLQFQCQLAELLGGAKGERTPLPIDPCGDTRGLLGETLTVIEALGKGIHRAPSPVRPDVVAAPAAPPAPPADTALDPLDFQLAGVGGIEGLSDLGKRVRAALAADGGTRRILVDGGFVELPPYGLLPWDPHASAPLTQQVQDLLGPGLDLRFCAIRADQAGGEFEAAQHLDRISLLRGIDDPSQRELVDILVPDGKVGEPTAPLLFELDMALSPQRVDTRGAMLRRAELSTLQIPLGGVARVEQAPQGPFALYAAVAGGVGTQRGATSAATWVRNVVGGERIRRTPNFGEGTVSDVGLGRVASTVRSAATGELAEAPIAVAPAAGEGEAVVGWVELRFDGNPFTVGRGNGGVFGFEVLLYIPTRAGSVGGIEANGRYRVERVLSAQQVQIVVHGQAVTRQTDETRPVETFDLSFTLEHDNGALTVTGDADAAVEWGGSPTTASAELRLRRSSFAVGAKASQSDAADDPGNDHHDRAMKALTILEGAQGAGFAEEAAAKLFESRGSGTVQTVHDWVAFRRRTHYDCGAVEAPRVEDRRVDAWHLQADGRPHGERVWAAIEEGEFDEAWRPFATPVFAGDTATLRTSAAQLRARWIDPEVRGGNVVLFGAYAGTGATTQPAGRDRLRNIVRALRPTAVLEGLESAALRLIGPPPNELVKPGSDGAVFLISLQVELLCAEAYIPKDVTDDDLWGLVREPSVTLVQQAIDDSRLVRLGTVRRNADGSFDLGAVEGHVRGVTAPSVVVWAHDDWLQDGHTAGDAEAFAIEALEGVAESPDVETRTATFERGDCPLRVFVRAVERDDG